MRLRLAAVAVAAVLVGSLLGSGATAEPFDGGTGGPVACGAGTISFSPAKLWPPDHTLRDVTITGTGTAFTVTGVTHEEEGIEKGSTAKHEPDFVITDPSGGATAEDTATVQLLSERRAKPKNGRTYSITVTCGDPLAGGGTATLTVTVLHNRKKPR